MKDFDIIELQKEESEGELKEIELTIQKVKAIQDEIKPNTTANQEVKLFLNKLDEQKRFCEAILDEQEHSLEIMRAREDYILELAREEYYENKQVKESEMVRG